jgi:methylenetetrahydrofolate dehydrogenase (NADP+)/methenyltetrahydrofolate cyclohydrolase
MTEQILGGKILKTVKNRCEPYRDHFQGKRVTIAMFDPPETETNTRILGQYQAAVTSTNQKSKTFEFLGCSVDRLQLPAKTLPTEFDRLLQQAASDSNSLAIIVQNPIPNDKLKRKLSAIPAHLDIDAINENHRLFKANATSESIARLVRAFATPDSRVAVVGAGGFVGRGVVKLLEDSQIQWLGLDLGDSLNSTHEADIVVSATGRQELLNEQHILPSHRLVVDSGFIPQPDGSIKGDVNLSAYDTRSTLLPSLVALAPCKWQRC